MHRRVEAINLLQTAADSDICGPHFALVHYNLGVLFSEVGRLENAMAHARMALEAAAGVFVEDKLWVAGVCMCMLFLSRINCGWCAHVNACLLKIVVAGGRCSPRRSRRQHQQQRVCECVCVHFLDLRGEGLCV